MYAFIALVALAMQCTQTVGAGTCYTDLYYNGTHYYSVKGRDVTVQHNFFEEEEQDDDFAYDPSSSPTVFVDDNNTDLGFETDDDPDNLNIPYQTIKIDCIECVNVTELGDFVNRTWYDCGKVSSDSGLDENAIIGITIASVFVFIVVVVYLYSLYQKRRKKLKPVDKKGKYARVHNT